MTDNPENPNEYTKEDMMEAFEDLEDGHEPLTAVEVGEKVGCSRHTASDRLDSLVWEDRLKTKKTGARGRVYWR